MVGPRLATSPGFPAASLTSHPRALMLRSLLFFLPLTAGAASFTLESAVSQALRHHPDLAAARCAIAEARGRLAQSGRLPNPEAEANLQPNLNGREFSAELGLVQRFPLTQRLALERAASQAQVAAAIAEVQAAEQRLAAAVRSAAVKLLSLDASQALKERLAANSTQLAAAARQTAAQGEGSSLEAAQFELEAQQLSLDLLQLQSARADLVGSTRPLLGLPPSASLTFTGNLAVLPPPGPASPNLPARPDYQAALARLEAARQESALARTQRWSDAGVGLSAKIDRAEDAPDGLRTEGLIGLKFTLPLPLWQQNHGRIQETDAAADRAAKELAALDASIRAEAAAALDSMQAARRVLAQLSAQLLPKAAQLEAQFLAHLQSGQPGAQRSDLLRAREKHLALEQAEIDARLSYHLALIRYQAALAR